MSVLKEWDMLIPNNIIDKAEELNQKAADLRRKCVIVYPPQDEIFRAFDLAPENVNVVILGQDPYHEKGQANGYAFSVNKGCPIPPSLRNIYQELAREYKWEKLPSHGDLSSWVEQGVFLLNTSLTSYEGEADGCRDWKWEVVTQAVLQACMMAPQPVVFLLWGRHAIDLAKKSGVCEMSHKHIIRTSHPSPLGVTKAGDDFIAFQESGQFKDANVWLTNHGCRPIFWEIPD